MDAARAPKENGRSENQSLKILTTACVTFLWLGSDTLTKAAERKPSQLQTRASIIVGKMDSRQPGMVAGAGGHLVTLHLYPGSRQGMSSVAKL